MFSYKMNSYSKKPRIPRRLAHGHTTFRIAGDSRKYGEGVLLFTKEKNGWRQKVEQGSKLFHDSLNVRYVCNEDISKLEEWIRLDFIRFSVILPSFA